MQRGDDVLVETAVRSKGNNEVATHSNTGCEKLLTLATASRTDLRLATDTSWLWSSVLFGAFGFGQVHVDSKSNDDAQYIWEYAARERISDRIVGSSSM